MLSYESFLPELEEKWRQEDKARPRAKDAAKASLSTSSLVPELLSEESLTKERQRLAQLPAKQLRARMVSMCRQKAHAAKSLHGHAKINGRTLNDWFESAPDQLVDELANR